MLLFEKLGASNCSWTSCREGCTKEIYDCTQIRVNYKLPKNLTEDNGEENIHVNGGKVGGAEKNENRLKRPRYERSLMLREYDYIEDLDDDEDDFDDDDEEDEKLTKLPKPFPTGKINILLI